MSTIRRYIAGLIIVSVLCISVATLIFMVREAGCIAEAVNGGVCPVSSFALLNFHMSAFSKLTQTLISFFVSFCVIALSLWIVAAPKSSSIGYRTYFQRAHIARQPLRRWIAIHETSPTARERA